MSYPKFFKNNVNSDIYIGTGAGAKLLKDIEDAQTSIRIISPYLNRSYVEKLINLKEAGKDVSLITSDLIEDFYDNRNLRKLIIQNRSTISEAKVKRDFLIKCKNWMLIFSSIIPILFFIDLYIGRETKILYLIIFSLLYAIALWMINSKIKRLRIYRYSYETLFPIKVFLTPNAKDYFNHSTYFIHSKVYVIDNKVAYLGSLNFTFGGFQTNFETRIRVSDAETIKGINYMFNELFYSNENSFVEIEQLAKRVYREPIN
ncbi:MAG: phospholipase D-like domain-containing protein [Bacteroidia bacterium]